MTASGNGIVTPLARNAFRLSPITSQKDIWGGPLRKGVEQNEQPRPVAGVPASVEELSPNDPADSERQSSEHPTEFGIAGVSGIVDQHTGIDQDHFR